MMKITATNALATRCFPHCKWYIVMVVSLIFLLRTSVIEVALVILYMRYISCNIPFTVE